MAYVLNAPRGLGDAIYVRALALHLLAKGEQVTLLTRWREVFTGLDVGFAEADEVSRVEAERFRSPRSDIGNVMACLHCQVPAIMALDKFALSCLQAGVTDEVELKAEWKVQNLNLYHEVKEVAAGRPVLVYQPLRKATNAAQELLRPRSGAFKSLLAGLKDHFKVKIGHPDFTDDDNLPCDLNLYGKTSVTDVFDIASAADLIVGENCFLPVLAQAMDKRFALMFSRRAMSSPWNKVRGIAPERMMQKPALGTAVFDE